MAVCWLSARTCKLLPPSVCFSWCVSSRTQFSSNLVFFSSPEKPRLFLKRQVRFFTRPRPIRVKPPNQRCRYPPQPALIPSLKKPLEHKGNPRKSGETHD